MNILPPHDRRFQKRLSIKSENGGLNDYEELHIATPESGPYTTSKELHEALGMDFFSTKKLRKTQSDFTKQFTNRRKSYDLIERALSAYVKSAKVANKDTLQLKLSVIKQNYELEIALTENDERMLALEIHKEEIIKILKQDPLISANSLNYYIKTTRFQTINVLKEYSIFLDKNDPENAHNYLDIDIHRGFSNPNYYKIPSSSPDFLSIYTNEMSNEFIYYEPKILNSYTLSFDVAEKFMTCHRNQRRAMLYANFENIHDHLLASFITSSSFLKNQFELLSIPNVENFLIRQEKNDPSFSIFYLC